MLSCRQAISHYLSLCYPRSMPPYGFTRPQWVKVNKCNIKLWRMQSYLHYIYNSLLMILFYTIDCTMKNHGDNSGIFHEHFVSVSLILIRPTGNITWNEFTSKIELFSRIRIIFVLSHNALRNWSWRHHKIEWVDGWRSSFWTIFVDDDQMTYYCRNVLFMRARESQFHVYFGTQSPKQITSWAHKQFPTPVRISLP